MFRDLFGWALPLLSLSHDRHLELVPVFLESFPFTLCKTDTSLNWTPTVLHCRSFVVCCEFMQQNCRKKRTAKRLSVANVTGLLLACFLCLDPHLTLMFSGLCKKNLKFGVKLFQTKLLSRLSHNVCCLLSPPVLLRKFTSDFNQRLTTATAEITSKKAVRLRKQKKLRE